MSLFHICYQFEKAEGWARRSHRWYYEQREGTEKEQDLEFWGQSFDAWESEEVHSTHQGEFEG